MASLVHDSKQSSAFPFPLFEGSEATMKSPSSQSIAAKDSKSKTNEEVTQQKPPAIDASSLYLLANDRSLTPNEVVGLQRSQESGSHPSQPRSDCSERRRSSVIQRSVMNIDTSMGPTGLWYMLAMVLPIISMNNAMQWTCTPSQLLNSLNVVLNEMKRFCFQIRCQLRRLAQEQITRDFFASLMDIVLVIYALGFLIISLYQASVFG